MTCPGFSFVPVMDHEVHVTCWGAPSNKPLIMWHGLARTGRDFDELASALSDEYFVLCPDTIGRGLSSWSENPEAEYSIEYYSGIATDLMDHFSIAQASWIGTSLGGLIGMRLASGPAADRLNGLIINDIGPEVPQAAIDRILSYAESQPIFYSMQETETWLRTVYQPFGPASDAFWTRMARTSVRRRADGTLTTHFDPRITVQFTASVDELTSWDRFARISIPMHVIRGATSDLLSAETVSRMEASNARISSTVIPDAGHAPTLSRTKDIQLVRSMLHRLTG